MPRKRKRKIMNPAAAEMFYYKLAVHVLYRAYLDLDSKSAKVAHDARLWFMTPDASRYAELACLNPVALKKFVRQLWRGAV